MGKSFLNSQKNVEVYFMFSNDRFILLKFIIYLISATAWVTTRSDNVSRRETVLSSDRVPVCLYVKLELLLQF